MESLDVRRARRLALARAGLLKPEWTGLPRSARGRGKRARRAALATVDRFGYLQLDTVSVAGARSHSLVLLSRFEGMDPQIGEDLLNPSAYEGGRSPIFEFWGHEACWMPNELYPFFAFRRRALRRHSWVAPWLDDNPDLADAILTRAREQGPFRSADLEGTGSGAWWGFKKSKKVATSLWSAGELAIRQRQSFQRTFDLPENVVPDEVRHDETLDRSLEVLLGRALAGHGWATTATLADTWRLRNLRPEIHAALERMRQEGEVVACQLDRGRRLAPIEGWVRPGDLELAEKLHGVRPGSSRGVLLSPFDPVLWDRQRVALLFDFEQTLEIFKPEPQRVYGYFCLPVLAGEQLVARVDLKAHRRQQRLEVKALHLEPKVATEKAERAARQALERYANDVELELD
ncbi:MAG: crosslink repair DNA glycosylase YcaQ family protein [Acidobacteriota bacterium]